MGESTKARKSILRALTEATTHPWFSGKDSCFELYFFSVFLQEEILTSVWH